MTNQAAKLEAECKAGAKQKIEDNKIRNLDTMHHAAAENAATIFDNWLMAKR